jgi:hypothetical protein
VQITDQEDAEAYSKTAMTSINSGGTAASRLSSLAAIG